jgi:cobalamin biosynthesis Mg chelatase CobN
MQKFMIPKALSHGFFAVALATLLALAPGFAPKASAEDHIVSSQALQQQVENSSAARQSDISNLTNFLSTPQAEQAMRSAKVDPVQVRTAIPTLSNAELANLSQRATHAQQQFSAGMIGTGMLLVIVIAIVVVIILIAYA